VLEEKMDYEMTLWDMMAELPSQGLIHDIAKGSIKKLYEKDPLAEDSRHCRWPGMKMTELADKFAKLGVSTYTIFMEWSTAWSDLHCVSSSLRMIGRKAFFFIISS